jgi:hypothetical protein
MPVHDPARVGIKFQPVRPAEPAAPCQQCQRGDQHDHRDQDPEPVELPAKQGRGDAVVVVGAVEDAMHQAGGKQAVAGASEDDSDQWSEEEAKEDVGDQRDQHRCDGDLAEEGERQVMNPNSTAVKAAATKMLCRRSSRVCITPAQAVSSRRLTKMKLINSSRS